jgi:hypothetical protein
MEAKSRALSAVSDLSRWSLGDFGEFPGWHEGDLIETNALFVQLRNFTL